MEENQREVQDLIAQAQHLLHKAESRLEQYNECSGNKKLESYLDAAQRSLVDAQLLFVDGKEGEELLEAFFSKGPTPDLCRAEWDKELRLLKIFIPDSWERVSMRPSIYIKDILKYRNATKVKLFYTKLFRAILDRAKETGELDGFEMFEQCFAGFVFHFPDKRLRDPDNFLVKVLIDAIKNTNVFLTDDYKHLLYFAAGISDEDYSGMTLYFTDDVNSISGICSCLFTNKQHKNYTTVDIKETQELCDSREKSIDAQFDE